MTAAEIKKSTRDQIMAATGNNQVYSKESVPKKPGGRYVTYELGSSVESDRDNCDDLKYPLVIDIWDIRDDGNTSQLDTLMDDIDVYLNRRNVIEDTFYYMLIRTNKLPDVPDPDEHTYRRQLRYTMDIHTR